MTTEEKPMEMTPPERARLEMVGAPDPARTRALERIQKAWTDAIDQAREEVARDAERVIKILMVRAGIRNFEFGVGEYDAVRDLELIREDINTTMRPRVRYSLREREKSEVRDA